MEKPTYSSDLTTRIRQMLRETRSIPSGPPEYREHDEKLERLNRLYRYKEDQRKDG